MIEESPIYQDILHRGEERGEKRGHLQGFDEGVKDTVLSQLSQRFGPLHWRTRQQITSLSTKLTQELSRTLLELRDLSELRVWLKAHKRAN